jgi:hypothetical protein
MPVVEPRIHSVAPVAIVSDGVHLWGAVAMSDGPYNSLSAHRYGYAFGTAGNSADPPVGFLVDAGAPSPMLPIIGVATNGASVWFADQVNSKVTFLPAAR